MELDDLNIKLKIDRKKIISFDIFDTLLERKVQHPDHVYTLIKNHLVSEHGEIMNDYVDMRKHSYYLALNSQQLYGREDVSLSQICDYAAKLYPNVKINREDLVKAEEHIERTLLKKKEEGYQLYQYCVEKNKKIFFTSDMHLSREFLAEVLESCGYNTFDNLYVSGDVGLLKHNGKLFEWLLMENNLDLDDVLHIGDNIHTDYNMARSVGLDAVHFYDAPEAGSIEFMACSKSAVRAAENIPSGIAVSLLKKCLKENKIDATWSDEKKYFHMLGLTFVGPICNYICNSIRQDMSDKNITKILFFSRDGHIVYKCFKLLYPDVDCEYVYASRRMTCYTVGMINREKYVHDYMHGVLKSHTLQEALDALPSPIVSLFREQHDLDIKNVLCSSKVRKHLRIFLDSNFEKIKSSYQSEFNSVSEYYQQSCAGNQEVAVFDLGWRGNMQIGFDKILSASGSQVKTHGYYFGLLYDSLNSLNKNNWTGIFLHLDRPYEVLKTLFNGTPVMEFLFSTNHPSIARIEKDSATGKFVPVYEDSGKEYEDCNEYHSQVHNGATDFVKSFAENYVGVDFNRIVDKQSMINMIRSFLLHPKRIDGQMFAKASISSGISQSITRPIVDYKLRTNNPRRLYHGKENSLWKEGFNACMNKKRNRLIELYSFMRNI